MPPPRTTRCLFLYLFITAVSLWPVSGMADDWQITGNAQARARMEGISAQPGNATNQDTLLVTRLQSQVVITHGALSGIVEVSDARALGYRAITPLGSDDVNALEPVQAKLLWRDALDSDTHILYQVGRFTMDLGSRRLVARNRFRNTLNTFDGLSAQFTAPDWQISAFHTHPVTREPADRAGLENADIQLDSFDSATQFSGLYGSFTPDGHIFDLHLFRRAQTARHELRWSAGGRLRAVLTRAFSSDAEFSYQWGKTGSDQVTINAWFVHAGITYHRHDSWGNSLSLVADVATGNDAQTPDEEGFSTLYGARRFEYGPTGIYGLFARGNILSPGVKWTFAPLPVVKVSVTVRTLFAFEGSSPSGRLQLVPDASGRTRLGNQLEGRAIWTLNDQLSLEAGLAHAALSNDVVSASRNITYGYSQISWRY